MSANSEKVKRYRRKMQERITAHKEGTPCADCGQSYPPYVMDYHHRDPATKEFKVSLARANTWAWSRVKAEIDKCDLLCANCHRIREHSVVA